MNLKNWLRGSDTGGGVNLPSIALVLLAFGLFWVKFGAFALNPNEVDWLMDLSFDSKTEWLSWRFYRQTAWHFPVIGTMEGYLYPTVTGVGQTGAVPLVAIPFKILSPILPKVFNYFGYWFLACLILQAHFGRKLLMALGVQNSVSLILGGAFFLLAPVLPHRLGHINLVCHFLILAAFWLYFEKNMPHSEKIRRGIWLVLISAAVHQYVTVMVWGLTTATSLTLLIQKNISFKKWFFAELLKALGIFLVFYLVGNFLIPFESNQIVGYGKFASNLNAFFNPFEFSRFFKSLPTIDGHYEGFAYFGVGFGVLVLLVLLNFLFKKNRILGGMPVSWILGLFVLTFWVYSWSNQIHWGTTKLAHIKDANIEFVGNMFRGSGRFIWVIYYFLMGLFLAKFFTANYPNILKNGLGAVFLVVQFYELLPLYDYYKSKKTYDRPTNPEKWTKMTAEADRLICFPFGSWDYARPFDAFPLAEAAANNGQAISTGYLSRPNLKLVFGHQKNMLDELEKGENRLENRSIFVVATSDSSLIRQFEGYAARGLFRSFRFDGYPVFVPPSLLKTIEFLEREGQK